MQMKMIEKRFVAASVAIPKWEINQNTSGANALWVVGGQNETNRVASDLYSTELITLGQPSINGPELPFTIKYHSMIQYDEKSIYIIGGDQNNTHLEDSARTWIVDPTNGFQIKEGPLLNNFRMNHGCAKMTLNGRTILVVAGGWPYVDSVEILDPSENNMWTLGPNLPLGFYKPIMVTSPTGKGVVIMGGTKERAHFRKNEFSKTMFELTETMQWTILEPTLQIDHEYPLALPIPDVLVSKQD